MDGFAVDPAGLSTAATGYGDARDELATLHTQLSAGLAALDGCWGDDEPGQAFAAVYVRPAAATHESFHPGRPGSVAAGLHELMAGLQWCATNYTANEETTVARTPRLDPAG
ncbi:MAG TPA: hypothetical protein VMU51_05210 [Mycobacteriales bacterium]|nr:hypothetical protein [Mycobacteriales bacterium]